MKRGDRSCSRSLLGACGLREPLQPRAGRGDAAAAGHGEPAADHRRAARRRRRSPGPSGSTSCCAAPRSARTTASICRRATSRSDANGSDGARMKPVRKAVFPVAGPRHPLPARHQGDPEGDADGRRSAADPICGRGGARGRDRADDLRHRPRQGRARGPFRHRLRARGDDDRARQVARRARRHPLPARRDRLGPPAGAARASATPSGARARSSATSRSRCCSPTI